MSLNNTVGLRRVVFAAHRARTNARGVTLIELLVVVAVVGLIAAIGVPSYADLQARRAAAAERDQLLQAIRLARTNALAQRRTTIVCASADGQNCGNDWSRGWLVGVSAGCNSAIAAADRLRSHTIGANRANVAASASCIAVNARGEFTQSSTWTVTTPRFGAGAAAPAWRICVSPAQIRVADPGSNC